MEEKTLSIEESLLRQVNKKKRKRRIRKVVRLLILLLFIALIVLYLMSDMAKVKSLMVENNSYYSKTQILEKAGLDYSSNYVLTPKIWVNYKLEKDPLIQDAKLKKDFHGGFTIHITEEKVIGYLALDQDRILIQGKGLVEIDSLDMKSFPRIGEFSAAQLTVLDKAFKNVDASVLPMISEILPHSETYNSEMVMLVMNDGNRVTSSYNGIELINRYKRILPQLEGTHVCLFMDELSGSIIKQNVDCVKKNSEENK